MENLRQAIIQDLEASGYFDKMRAKIRSELFRTAEVHENKAKIQREETTSILDSEFGQISAALVKDFLISFDLQQSLDIFLPESHQTDGREDIENLEEMFQVKTQKGRPLLFSVIEYLIENAGEEGSDAGFSQDSHDLGKTGSHLSSTIGNDPSTYSLAREEFDHIEPVRKKRFP